MIIAGPPHSGKSVFISALTTVLRSGECGGLNKDKLFPLNFDATPDGERNFVKENYAVDEDFANALRKKGTYSDKLRNYIKRCITNCKHPLMLIDIGGKFRDDDIEMLENATHAIILSGGEVVSNKYLSKKTNETDKPEINFDKSVNEWTEFFEKMNIKVLTSVKSDYEAFGDYTENGVMSIHHLDRLDFEEQGRVKSEATEKRPNIMKICEIICEELKKNETVSNAYGNSSKISEYDELKLVSKHKERKWGKSEDGSASSLEPLTYDSPGNNLDGVMYAGAYSAHVLAKKIICDLQNERNVQFHDPYLEQNISIIPLELGETDRKWFDEPEYIGCHFGKKIFQIRTLTNHSQNILFPEDLEKMRVPKVPADCIVKIVNSGAQWFGAIIAASYMEHCAAIGISMLVDKTEKDSTKNDDLNDKNKNKKNSEKPKKRDATVIVWSKLDNLPAVKDNEWLTDQSKCVILDKPTIYIDMDGVLADFEKGKDKMFEIYPEYREKFADKYKNMPGLFESLPPMNGAIDAAMWISKNFNAFILTSSPWQNETAVQAKIDWIKRHFTDENGFNPFKRKVIISHHKEQLIGDILIDDRNTNGVHVFKGTHIWFGKKSYENWNEVIKKLQNL